MSFLTPLYIAGLAAISLPVIFHLIRRTPKGRVTFSTTMFLDPSPPRLTRRSRIEHWLLLALRSLALLLLAFAFARPFLREVLDVSRPVGQGIRTAILIDQSASMRRDRLYEMALDKARQRIRDAEMNDSVAIYGFDRDVTPLLTFEEWHALEADSRRAAAIQRLEKHNEPGWGATALDAALMRAADDLDALAMSDGNELTPELRIVLISDLQSGSSIEQLQSYEWPDGVHVVVDRLGASGANAGLQLLTRSESTALERVRISNAADSNVEEFRVQWMSGNALASQPVEVYVAPGRSRTIPVPDPDDGMQGDRLIVTGDQYDFDNTVFLNESDASEVLVHYYGRESSDDPEQLRFYLERAFPETPQQSVTIVAPDDEPERDATLDHRVRMVVSTIEPRADRLDELKSWMEDGGTPAVCASTAWQAQAVGEADRGRDPGGRGSEGR